MKRKIAFLLIVVGLLAGIFGVVRLLGFGGTKQGELKVDSNPEVSVFLDNQHLGRTPLRQKINVGEYTIRLSSDSPTSNVASWQGRIIVGSNVLTYVNASLAESELSSAVDVIWLERISGRRTELSVVTNPDGATVHIDNETRGATPLTLQDIGEGEHSLNVTSPGFATRNMQIRTSSGFKVVASLKLALSANGVPLEATPAATPTPGEEEAGSTTSADPDKPYALILDTPTGFLRVRAEPTTSATESAQVEPGEKYSILDEENGWYQIQYNANDAGWISGQYAEKVE